jgi:hypothetical protein
MRTFFAATLLAASLVLAPAALADGRIAFTNSFGGN